MTKRQCDRLAAINRIDCEERAKGYRLPGEHHPEDLILAFCRFWNWMRGLKRGLKK